MWNLLSHGFKRLIDACGIDDRGPVTREDSPGQDSTSFCIVNDKDLLPSE